MARETLSVTRQVTLAAPASEVRALIGDFHGLDRWHPAVARSERAAIGEDEFRVLTTGDGARILEHLVDKGTHAYSYTIVRSPLPVAHYEARLEVDAKGPGSEVSGSEVIWSGSFTPTADNAERVIAGIYEAGLSALAERFGAL